MALPAGTVWEVRTTGSDSNAGGFVAGASGTDYSQQDNLQFNGGDLASSNGTNASPQVTAVGHLFVGGDVGNVLRITSGTNWTAGFYQIVSVAANAATLDRACGSAASLSNGSYTVGGAFASPGQAGAAHAGGNTIYVKSGTYSVTSASANVAAGCVSLTAGVTATNTRILGYGSSRGDGGTRPLLQASGISTFVLVTLAANCHAEYLSLDGASLTSSRGVAGATSARAYRCKGVNCTNSAFNVAICVSCEATTCATAVAFSAVTGHGCIAYANTVSGFGAGTLFNCASVNNTGSSSVHGFQNSSSSSSWWGCTAYGNAGDGFRCTAGTTMNTATNCLAVSNTGAGFGGSAAMDGWWLYNCATQGNGSATSNLTAANLVGMITLSGGPFTNAGSNDFSLNATAGAGAACRAAGLLGAFPAGLSTTGYADVGAAQHADPASATVYPVLGSSFIRGVP